MLSAKRLREHAALFAALLGVVALVSGLSVGIIGFLAQSADDGVRSGLATRAGADLALRASLALDPDPTRQDAEVRAAIDRSMQGLPIAVDRTVAARIDATEVTPGSPTTSHRVAMLSIPALPDRATLVDGAWPASPAEVSVQADAAARLELVPGDQLLIDDVRVTVTGIWRVKDHLDPRWMGETLLTDGVDATDFGPIVLDESVWSQLTTDPRARWTLVPQISHLTADDLVTIVSAWNRLGTDWRGQVSSQLITLEKQGRFKRTALELGTRVDGLQAIQPVVLLLLAAIALVTLAELGRLLTTTRSTEIGLLWSRGASALDIGRVTAAEAALAAAAGAALGTGAALGSLTLLLGPEAAGNVGSAVWVVPVVLTLGTVLVVAGSAFRSARRQTVRDPSDAAGRARRLAGPGVVILATGAAALSVWQLRLYDSP
ncbi:MAG: FtsX-like permease family protein, partial [Schumannella sp.]|nr:FtsX-like permease family protein [Schumannella sp.]